MNPTFIVLQAFGCLRSDPIEVPQGTCEWRMYIHQDIAGLSMFKSGLDFPTNALNNRKIGVFKPIDRYEFIKGHHMQVFELMNIW
jgi:hypothetical protein